MKKPVVFIIFNRPDTTSVVFEEIRKYKPKRLLIIADGPRANKENEKFLCECTRNVIKVDWECEVTKIYSEENLGCKNRIVSGLNEVFELVDEAIILEDDCVPHEDFFTYCENLLDFYKDEERIMAISGDNFQKSDFEIQESYYFSIYPHCWGWATWRRAWSKMDVEMKDWPKYEKSEEFKEICSDLFFKKYWTNIYNDTYLGEIDTWDYQWTYSCWYHQGLTILPSVNLVSNIGFGENATHTVSVDEIMANLPVYSLEFPLKHPTCIKRNFEADYNTSEHIYNVGKLKEKINSESLKIELLNYLTDIKNVQKLFENNVYIFGMGNLGKLLFLVFKGHGYSIDNFMVSKLSGEDQYFEGITVIEPKDLIEKENATILVTIEGRHDREIICDLQRRFKKYSIKIVSWKDIVNR